MPIAYGDGCSSWNVQLEVGILEDHCNLAFESIIGSFCFGNVTGSFYFGTVIGSFCFGSIVGLSEKLSDSSQNLYVSNENNSRGTRST